jgi:hypothetical protein
VSMSVSRARARGQSHSRARCVTCASVLHLCALEGVVFTWQHILVNSQRIARHPLLSISTFYTCTENVSCFGQRVAHLHHTLDDHPRPPSGSFQQFVCASAAACSSTLKIELVSHHIFDNSHGDASCITHVARPPSSFHASGRRWNRAHQRGQLHRVLRPVREREQQRLRVLGL